MRERFLGVLVGAALMLPPGAARALPSFSAQTGQPCTSCHIGGFGPQLTSNGREFKLLGYADGSAPYPVPFDAQIIASFTHTTADQPGGPAPGYNPNDNPSFDSASLFYAGRILPHFGAFVQFTDNNINKNLGIDNSELRYGRDVDVAGTDAIVGVSLNDAPTMQDVYNTTPVWRFPYVLSGLTLRPFAATRIEGGFNDQVAGLTAYTLIDDHLYLEGGAYKALSQRTERFFGVVPGDKLDGLAPYWRAALQQDWGHQFVAAGAFGLSGSDYPGFDRTYGTDSFFDVGIDFTYQMRVRRRDWLSIYVSDIIENSTRGASFAAGSAATPDNHLNSFNANASYYLMQHYGLTVGYFKIDGKYDPILYPSANGKPNSNGIVTQIDWTPFGQKNSFLFPYLNLRLGLQYTHFFQLDGLAANYDGQGSNASGADSAYFFAWFEF